MSLRRNDEEPKKTEQTKGQELWRNTTNTIGLGFGKIWSGICHLIPGLSNQEVEYDDGYDEHTQRAKNRTEYLVYLIFCVFGLIAGWLLQNYSAALIWKFASWAAGVSLADSLASGVPPSSPVTILASIVIIFCIYLVGFVLLFCLYFIMNFFFGRLTELEDCKQVCQIGLMYGVLVIILISLIMIPLPINIFLLQ